ncbi:MAG: agmatine deiminase family protein [Phycisphaerales bacterium]|nr:agmatine deiminase family protein [Phycisphaerales bacterium]
MRYAMIPAALTLLLTSTVLAQPTYPEGVPVPRHATIEELAWQAAHPFGIPKGAAAAPTGPVTAPGEYAQSEGILMAWEGGTTLNNIQRTMIRHITTSGNGKAFIAFDDTAERNSVMPTFATNSLSLGTDVSRVIPVVGATNAIWMRDYGPRYVYEGRVRVISDHTYNVTSRTLDNAFPAIFAPFHNKKRYVLPLVHGGGNYHLNSIGEGFATLLITDENPSRTAEQVQALWLQHWGVNTTITPAFSQAVDATRHIDMWMQILGDRLVFISDWPANAGSAQDVICDNRAAAMSAAGWTVIRLPARSLSGVHYTYTNMVVCNDLALISSYTNTTMQQYNAQVLAAYQSALPGKNVVAINSDALAVLSGVMHCIVMQIPAHTGDPGANGGLAPTVQICAPTFNAATVLNPGDGVVSRWISDDDEAVASITLSLSYDDGATWNAILGGTATVDDGAHTWIVPDRFTINARLRISATDGLGNTGSDTSPAFTINGTPCTADVGAQGGITGPDGRLDNNDFIAFVDLYFAGDVRADLGRQGGLPGGDGSHDNNDFVVFVNAYFTPC